MAEKTANEIYDAEHGTYQDDAEDIPDDQRFATGNMPEAPAPNPFKLGPMAPGGRTE
jgi:hypothetical protein